MIKYSFILCLLLNTSWLSAQPVSSVHIETDRTTLLDRYTAALPKLLSNNFGLPIVLDSSQNNGKLRGEVIGIIDHDIQSSIKNFNQPKHWCDILILHLNSKACTYRSGEKQAIHLYSGRKFYQRPDQATMLSMNFEVVETQENYLFVRLFSKKGPFGISDSLIELEATSLPSDRTAETLTEQTLVRLKFSYKMSWLSRQLTRFYLATLARDKVGFTVTGHKNNRPIYIKGLKGIIERNTIRYYLAIKTRLDSMASSQDLDKQFSHWFDATERYHRQLFELDKQEYLAAKEKELENQRKEQLKINQMMSSQ